MWVDRTGTPELDLDNARALGGANAIEMLGGHTGKAFHRTAQLGDGYFAPNAGPDQLKELLDKLDAACAEVGRKRDEIEVTAMWFGPAEGEDTVARYRDLGVSRLVAMLPALGKNPIEALDALGSFIAKF